MATYRYYVLNPFGPAPALVVTGWARTQASAENRTKPGGKVVYASSRPMALRRGTTTGPVLYFRPSL
jgi:hypothetical protein